MNLFSILDQAAVKWPDAIAVVDYRLSLAPYNRAAAIGGANP